MKHQIDPKIDCVFKALLGAEDNRNLLVHLLNAILSADLSTPIATVDILNPYNDKEFVEDKLSIVDVKARDNEGNLYQIEIQLVNFTDLPERILYNWADIYSEQLRNGEGYYRLKPTYSIWLLAENLIKAGRESLFLRKIFPGFLLEKSAKNYATANAFGCPDSSSSPRFDPTRGRNIGSK